MATVTSLNASSISLPVPLHIIPTTLRDFFCQAPLTRQLLFGIRSPLRSSAPFPATAEVYLHLPSIPPHLSLHKHPTLSFQVALKGKFVPGISQPRAPPRTKMLRNPHSHVMPQAYTSSGSALPMTCGPPAQTLLPKGLTSDILTGLLTKSFSTQILSMM